MWCFLSALKRRRRRRSLNLWLIVLLKWYFVIDNVKKWYQLTVGIITSIVGLFIKAAKLPHFIFYRDTKVSAIVCCLKWCSCNRYHYL
jgi:uncharacterized membrane protein